MTTILDETLELKNKTRLSSTFLECQVCFEPYNALDRVPLVLVCGHTCCSHCLRRVITTSHTSHGRIACPLCRREQPSVDFPRNFALLESIEHFSSTPTLSSSASLADALPLSLSASPPTMPTCEKCQQSRVLHHCQDCAVQLCDECWHHVHSFGRFKAHLQTPIRHLSPPPPPPPPISSSFFSSSSSFFSSSSSSSFSDCPHHLNSPADLVCIDPHCLQSGHSIFCNLCTHHHPLQPITLIAASQRHQLTRALESVQQRVDKLLALIAAGKTIHDQLQGGTSSAIPASSSQLEEAMTAIDAAYQRCLQELADRRQQLVEEVVELAARKVVLLQAQTQELNAQLNGAQQVTQEAHALLNEQDLQVFVTTSGRTLAALNAVATEPCATAPLVTPLLQIDFSACFTSPIPPLGIVVDDTLVTQPSGTSQQEAPIMEPSPTLQSSIQIPTSTSSPDQLPTTSIAPPASPHALQLLPPQSVQHIPIQFMQDPVKSMHFHRWNHINLVVVDGGRTLRKTDGAGGWNANAQASQPPRLHNGILTYTVRYTVQTDVFGGSMIGWAPSTLDLSLPQHTQCGCYLYTNGGQKYGSFTTTSHRFPSKKLTDALITSTYDPTAGTVAFIIDQSQPLIYFTGATGELFPSFCLFTPGETIQLII